MNLIAASTAPALSSAPAPVTQLNSARLLVEARYTDEQPLTRAALHLIDCATEIVTGLPGTGTEHA
ncbi:hypothetical protein [Streptomyces sp. NPDC046821]|uniref:hypothetical protein n=1 Tax=Streptomyces sp. NPDC046821 TaxID=3154702 RepID=UPI0033D8A836